jgi:hypothetical protein
VSRCKNTDYDNGSPYNTDRYCIIEADKLVALVRRIFAELSVAKIKVIEYDGISLGKTIIEIPVTKRKLGRILAFRLSLVQTYKAFVGVQLVNGDGSVCQDWYFHWNL